MELTKRELNNLKTTRAWSAWVEAGLPLTFLSSLEDEIKDLLIEMLMHFELWGRVARSVNGDSALVVTENDNTLVEQLQRLLQYNVQQLFIVTIKGDSPLGPQERLISHFTFAAGKAVASVGTNDKKRLEGLWSVAKKDRRDISREEFDFILKSFSKSFLEQGHIEHVAKNIILFHRCLQDINVKVELQNDHDQEGLVCIAMANRRSSKTGFVLNLIKVIRAHGFKLEKAQSIYVANDGFDEKALIHFYVRPIKVADIPLDRLTMRLLDALAMVQWFEFENTMNRGYVYDLGLSLHHSILLRSIEEFVYQMLVAVDESLYTPQSIHEAMVKYPGICEAYIAYFISRFNPVQGGDEKNIAEKREALEQMIGQMDSGISYNDKRRKKILTVGVNFLESIQKTNYYVIRRSSLSYRVCPDILDKVLGEKRELHFPEKPFAIFYVKGKNFIGFNIRFRDLARGGVRTLIPLDKEKRAQQHKEVFRECYNLAHTQQFKNKDIPEGGSKSVIFVKLHSSFERDLESDKNILIRMKSAKGTLEKALADTRNTLIRRQLFDAQQSFCDTLLDIVIWDKDKGHLKNDIIKDEYGQEELVFLGPDENMTNPMIEWISNRSADRGYRIGSAFMSGKQSMGINHKAYGVTSLGVHEYLKEGLSHLGLDKGEISVKVSGGPDGDVAGNEIVNLIKDFSTRLKLLSIQDGTGMIYDPEGVNQDELLRLFEEGLGVAKFDPNLLKNDGFLLLMHERRVTGPGVEEVKVIKTIKKKSKSQWLGASEANSLYSHFLLGLKSDVFMPCGGRPRTLSVDNWQDFLAEDGSPSSGLIVEGANLYLDEFARQELEKKGVVIIKDASANKCGVICSSYEIMSGLLLSPEEFEKNKEQIVKEVIEILKDRAQKEAKLLLNCPEGESRIQLTEILSNKINALGDQIRAEMPRLKSRGKSDELLSVVAKEAIPPTLLKLGGARLEEQPDIYKDALVASFLASSLIYKYGLNYQPSLVDSLNFEIENGLFSSHDTD